MDTTNGQATKARLTYQTIDGRNFSLKAKKCRLCGTVTTNGMPWGWAGFQCWPCVDGTAKAEVSA